MNRVQVIPAEGFAVKDNAGRIIPAAGASVELSPVIAARLREGLLVQINDDELVDDDAGEFEDGDDELELDRFTKTQLLEIITEHGHEAKSSDTKAELVVQARQILEAAQ